jgi:hypothetical protein
VHKVPRNTIVYKAAKTSRGAICLVSLELTRGTWINRVITSQEKNRASRAIVVAINRIEIKDSLYNHSGNVRKEQLSIAYSDFKYDNLGWDFEKKSDLFPYILGKTVIPRKPFSKSREECASGIHFFINKQKAIDYLL